MSQKYQKLKELLKTLFQLDQPDLDFGLYRIMHAKSAEITQFLDHDLLPQVKRAFSQYQPADKAEIQKALDLAIEQAHALGADPETLPKVKELRERLANEAVDLNALEGEVYDHLYSFFRRYYDEGDFLSKRVYKPGVYAIPYEGEETKFTWANQDQYYIKTSEYLRDYAFRLRPEDEADPMRVHFRLVDAAEGEHGNVKAAEGKERLFVLAPNGDSGHDFIQIVPGENGNAAELQISFEYRPVTLTDWPESEREGKKNPPKQENLRSIAVERILGAQGQDLLPWIAELAKPHTRKDGSQAELSRLQAHLDGYTKRNTFDYFIHKDLGGFLRREIDFYIKNEMMHLDDIESESAPRVEQYLSKIKVVRTIAGKIIDFLAQLEDFQKKLWLKKKLVVETSYCITLGLIPQEFYPEIASNDTQREEWVRLNAIDTTNSLLTTAAQYSVPLTIDFLKSYPSLMIDTRHFTSEFRDRIVQAIPDFDREVSGILLSSENAQALALMQARFRQSVNCIYIDPPYNTDSSSIDYKNGYKSSSWMSLMNDRIALSQTLLQSNGVLIAAIDDEQHRELSFLLGDLFNEQILGTFCVRSNPSGRPTKSGYSVSHEYLIFAGRGSQSQISRMPPTKEQAARFNERDEEGVFEWRNLRREGSGSDRDARRTMYYPIYIDAQANTIRIPEMEWDESSESWQIKEEPRSHEEIVLPINEDGVEKRWRWEHKSVTDRNSELAIRKDRTGKNFVYAKRRPHEDGVVSVSSWFEAKYSATEHGTALLKALFGTLPFSYPKSIHAVEDAIYIGGANSADALILDYFGGSGTTAHAVINLNRKCGGKRKFITSEIEDHFDSVLIPRLKKVAFAPQWEEGKPSRICTSEEVILGPKIFKVLVLESYEDALNNLEVQRTITQQNLLNLPDVQYENGFREDYLLKYMLNVETRGSQSLLNVKAFSDPTAYKLRVKKPGTDESREVNVDLLETFNWLIGLHVKHIAAPQSFVADFERDTEGRLRLTGRMTLDANGPWWFRRVEGTTPDGRNALIVWRKLTGNPEQDNLMLDSWMKDRLKISTRDFEFDLIYVNGDNNLENLKLPDDTWKVRLIEEDFHRLMFDAEGL